MAGSDERPFVSVIIPVYGAPAGLAECLACLARQTYPRDRFETLVVDNGCPRIGRVLARHPGVVCLKASRPGSFAARNVGLEAARGEIVAFTDADCLPVPEWIERAVANIGAPDATGLVAGPIEVVRPRPRGASPTAYAYDLIYNYRSTPESRAGVWAATANLVVRRSVFDVVGPFNAGFLSGGDVEWGRRAAATGFRIRWDPAVCVGHQARGSIRMIISRALRLAGGNQMNRQTELMPTPARMLVAIVKTELLDRSRSAMDVLRGAEGTRVERGQVALLVALIQVLRAVERIRVFLGGAPRRA